MEAEDNSEPNVKEAVPFFWVRDIGASLTFYIDGLGFEMAHKWTHEGKVRWCWLRLGKASLMLQEFWKEGPDVNWPEGELGLGMSICFMCRDAIAICHEAKDRGLQPSIPSVGNGLWVTSLSDPDGYRIDFESPTDAPEESIYSEPGS